MDRTDEDRAEQRCLGFDDNGKGCPCPNAAGTPWTRLWCLPCDERRRERITRQLESLQGQFGPKPA